MSELLVHTPVSPASAGGQYVGFEIVSPSYAGETLDRELCLVVVEGACTVRSQHGEWDDLGGRAAPFEGRPDAAYLPPGTAFEIKGEAEVALCSAPAPNGGAAPRVLPGDEVEAQTRGFGAQER